MKFPSRQMLPVIALIIVGGCAGSNATVARHYPPLPADTALSIDEFDHGSINATVDPAVDPAGVAALNALVAAPDTRWQPSIVTYTPQSQVRAGRATFTFTRGGWVAINSGNAEHPAPQYVRPLSERESADVNGVLRGRLEGP